MTWVAWRQHRNELIILLSIVAGLAVYLLPIGLDKHDQFTDSGLKACLQAGQDCPDLRFRFLDSYNSVSNIVGWFNFVPGIAGLLLAAPIVAEFEQRTYRLAWTQGVTRGRWLAARLGVALAGVAVFSVVLTLLVTWSYAPYNQSQLFVKDLGESYDFEGLMPFSYTFFAFALALAAGVVSRRAVAAIVAGLAGFVVARLLVMELLREGISSDVDVDIGPGQSLAEYARDMGLFWETQAQEAVMFVGAALLMLALTVWVVQRRMA